MATGPTPRSQKAGDRPIGFLLHDLAADTEPFAFNLVIRPEDLTRTETSRLAVQQTLGGAWADNFGRGLANITISGHTGWRGTVRLGDGLAIFQQLRDQVFLQWHSKREDAIGRGNDPDLVKLIFADALDDYAAVVAPLSFVLKRSKTRPLLAQYQIGMTVLSEDVDLQSSVNPLFASIGADAAAIDSLSASIGIVQGSQLGGLDGMLAGLGAASQQFAALTASVFKQVNGMVNGIQGGINSVVEPLVGVAANLAVAGRNIFQTISAIESIPSRLKADVMRLAGAYSNILCIFSNLFNGTFFYADYSSLFGASNCSSTSGGRPISQFMNSNGLEAAFFPNPNTNISVFRINGTANSALLATSGIDPVLAPPPTAFLRDAMKVINNGFTVNP